MKTFLINELKKSTKTGGKGICRVFLIEDNEAKDITKRIAELGKREKDLNNANDLVINYGSGTGTSIISEIIKTNWGKDVKIQDISIWKQ